MVMRVPRAENMEIKRIYWWNKAASGGEHCVGSLLILLPLCTVL